MIPLSSMIELYIENAGCFLFRVISTKYLDNPQKYLIP